MKRNLFFYVIFCGILFCFLNISRAEQSAIPNDISCNHVSAQDLCAQQIKSTYAQVDEVETDSLRVSDAQIETLQITENFTQCTPYKTHIFYDEDIIHSLQRDLAFNQQVPRKEQADVNSQWEVPISGWYIIHFGINIKELLIDSEDIHYPCIHSAVKCNGEDILSRNEMLLSFGKGFQGNLCGMVRLTQGDVISGHIQLFSLHDSHVEEIEGDIKIGGDACGNKTFLKIHYLSSDAESCAACEIPFVNASCLICDSINECPEDIPTTHEHSFGTDEACPFCHCKKSSK